MPVAKSYQKLEQIGNPYIKNNRMYVRVRLVSGSEKEVRWYNEKEYAKLYPGEENIAEIPYKQILGFEKGYITILKGNNQFCESLREARFHRLFGWYIISTETVPETRPDNLKIRKLYWQDISDDGKNLIEDKKILLTIKNLFDK